MPELKPEPAILPPSTIATYAREAGWRDDRTSNDPGQRHSELAVTIAIVLAESGGRKAAVNAIGATGLWQIYPGSPELKNALANARAAWSKYEANDRRFGSGPLSTCLWTAFCTRAYLIHLGRAEKAVKQTEEPSAVQAIAGAPGKAAAGILGFTGNIARDLATFFSWITSGETWIRLGEVAGGAILLLLALYLLFTHTQVGKDVRSVVTKGAA